MSPVRVSSDLLARLHAAQPPGTPLATVVDRALAMAGGARAVREALEDEDRRAGARARVARLRRMGHRSVVLDPDEQIALAEAARRWCTLLEEQGERRLQDATLVLRGRPVRGSQPVLMRRGVDR